MDNVAVTSSWPNALHPSPLSTWCKIPFSGKRRQANTVSWQAGLTKCSTQAATVNVETHTELWGSAELWRGGLFRKMKTAPSEWGKAQSLQASEPVSKGAGCVCRLQRATSSVSLWTLQHKVITASAWNTLSYSEVAFGGGESSVRPSLILPQELCRQRARDH